MAAQHCSPSGAGGYRGVLNQPEAEGNIDNPDVTRHYSGLEAILTHVHALQRLENGGRQELGELREKVRDRNRTPVESRRDTTEKELCRQVEQLTSQLSSVAQELDDTKLRLSKLMGEQLTDGNPDIADLSDKNRPTKIAEQYRELYDNAWTDAFETLNQTYRNDEKHVIGALLAILQNSWEWCTKQSQLHMARIKQALTGSEQGDEKLPSSFTEQLKDMQKTLGDVSGKHISKMYITELRRSRSSSAHDALRVEQFTTQCVQLCWLMCIHDPPVVPDFQTGRGDRLDTDAYKSYTRTGSLVEFIVWPALLLHTAGPLLCKGVAQPSSLRSESLRDIDSTSDVSRYTVRSRESYLSPDTSESGMTTFRRNQQKNASHEVAQAYTKSRGTASSEDIRHRSKGYYDSTPNRYDLTTAASKEIWTRSGSDTRQHKDVTKRTSNDFMNPHNNDKYGYPGLYQRPHNGGNDHSAENDLNEYFELLKIYHYDVRGVQSVMGQRRFNRCNQLLKRM